MLPNSQIVLPNDVRVQRSLWRRTPYSYTTARFQENKKVRNPSTARRCFECLKIAFVLDMNTTRGFQPRPLSGAYYTIFKVNCKTLVSRRADLSRDKFALNSLIRFVKIRRHLILGFPNAEIVPSRLNMRVGAALRYCSKSCLFARGLTGSNSTLTVIHTFPAPPKSISCL